MRYLSNAFSLSMLEETATITVESFDPSVISKLGVKSVVGHESTAKLFTQLLGMEVEVNRVNLKLKEGDLLIVGQYVGPRLPEGATELPEGTRIVWKAVSIHNNTEPDYRFD